MAIGGAARTMQGHEIGRGEQLIERGAMRGPRLRLDLGRGASPGEINHTHSETQVRLARRRLPDAAEADQSESASGHLGAEVAHRAPSGPGVVTDLPLARACTARSHQHQREGNLRRGLGKDVRCIGHDDAETLACLQVDVAHAHAVVPKDLHLACA